LVDDRSNTLIVVSSEAGYYRVKGLVDRLDIALDTEGGSAIHVFPLENALAEELATTLNNAMGQSTPQRPGQPGGRPGQPGAPGVPPVPQPQPQPIPGGPDNLGAALEGQVRVIGDKPTNSLIVMSTGRDFIAIKDVVRRLDHPRRQVFIEALILEVQIAKELDIGSSSIKMLQVKATPKGIRLLDFGIEPLPPQTIVDGSIMDHAAVVEAIKRLRATLGIRNKQVATLLSIADETVRMHMKNILGKLSANDRTHAVTIALTRGVIQL